MLHVVVCEQPQDLPLYVVFLEDRSRSSFREVWPEWAGAPGEARGWFQVVASDGALVRRSYNLLPAWDTLADVNGDGGVELFSSGGVSESTRNGAAGESVARVRTTVLVVVPVVEPLIPSFRVVYNPTLGEQLLSTATEFAYRVLPANSSHPAVIQLGPGDPDTNKITEVVAEWELDADGRGWVGPGGGLGRSFMRLPPAGYAEVDEFARSHAQ